MAITCPDDYIHFHESCYHFGHRSSDFTEAEVSQVITSAVGPVTLLGRGESCYHFGHRSSDFTGQRWVVLSLWPSVQWLHWGRGESCYYFWHRSSDFTEAEVSRVITSDIDPVTSLKLRWVVLSLRTSVQWLYWAEVSRVITLAIGPVTSLRQRWVVLSLRTSVQWLHWGRDESCYHFGHRSSDFTEAEVSRVITSDIGPVTLLRLVFAISACVFALMWVIQCIDFGKHIYFM